MGIQVAQNDWGASTHHHKQVLCAILSLLPCSMVDLVSKNSRFWAIFRTIVLQTRPWCHAAVRFEVKMNRF